MTKEKEKVSRRIEALDSKLKVKDNEIMKLEADINKKLEGMKKEMARRTMKTQIQSRCPSCEEAFDTNTDMEKHIQNVHKNQSFNCGECDATFVSEWRMKKHKGTHLKNTATRNCHYFNSNKTCPFQNLGCKFNHKFSIQCRYGIQCPVRMCQFKHQ